MELKVTKNIQQTGCGAIDLGPLSVTVTFNEESPEVAREFTGKVIDLFAQYSKQEPIKI